MTIENASVAAGLAVNRFFHEKVGWRMILDDRMQCTACGHRCAATFDQALAHHEKSREHAGVKVSQCDVNQISRD